MPGAGNARVRRGMLQLAWRLLIFQKDSALAQWYRARTADARGATRKTMIVALARKLLIALWRLVTIGEVPHGVVLRPRSQPRSERNRLSSEIERAADDLPPARSNDPRRR